MNNPELRAVLTEALGRHEFVPASFIADPKPANCACGEWRDSGPGQARVRHNFLEHFADAILSLPGVAVIQLPEPYFEATGDEFENGRKDYAFGDVSVFADGEIHLFGAVWDTAAIEEFAAGILAAVAESKRAAAAAAVVATGKEHHG